MTGRHRKDQPCCITVAFTGAFDWFLQRISPNFELWKQWPDDDSLDTVNLDNKETNPK